MDLTSTAPDSSHPEAADQDSLAAYAQRAYLEYALSVVKGRALPDACDGQKARAAAHFVQHGAHGPGLWRSQWH